MWKFNWKTGKERWILLLAGGLLLLVISIPTKPAGNSKGVGGEGGSVSSEEGQLSGSQQSNSYELRMERRVQEVLRTVDGVGKVDVMIVLKTSSEKVVRVDRNTSDSKTQEQDSSGGVRTITENSQEENTILMDGGNGKSPIVEKEINPEIAGIIISAEGGGSPKIKAEISEAMEALFDLPPHKIKVLKRVE